MSKKSAPSPKSGRVGRLPVAPKNAPARLAGRGGESTVLSVESLENAEEVSNAAMEIVRINKEIAALEEEKEAYKLVINGEMSTIKKDASWSVRSEDTSWIATYIVPKETKKLAPEKLLLAGVTPKQLEKGYKVVPAKKPYVQVRTAGQKTRENEEHE